MIENDTLKTNIPEFSVSALAGDLKRTLEDTYGRVRVRGELSRVSIAGSGHMYSTLKDEGAAIDAVCWRGTLSKLNIKPEEGLEVICTGRITTYPARSNYQLIIDSMELAGEGALLKMLEERKKKLSAEGLFNASRKKKLPFLPESIGVVTSPTGAVIRDILHRLEDRFPRHVLIWPVLVQGSGAAAQIAAAIRGFQSLDQYGLKRPDLLIVARGGGSLEDLMPFNEEIVVRAIAESQIPIISAVGHETDTTLSDYAADLRAPTPTGAAEMAVPVRDQILAQILDVQRRLYTDLSRLIDHARQKLETQNKGLRDPARLLEIKTQSLDHAGEALRRNFDHALSAAEKKLIEARARIRTPADRFTDAHAALTRWGEQLRGAAVRSCNDKNRAFKDLHARFAPPYDRMARATDLLAQTGGALRKGQMRHFENAQKNISSLAQTLRAYSFEKILDRGFAVVRDGQGKLVSDAAQVAGGERLEIQFRHRAFVKARVDKTVP